MGDSNDDDGGYVPGSPQDPRERREIRTKYRTLLNDVSAQSTELVSGATVMLKEKIDTTNSIFENVKHCREAALDAQCVASIAILGKKKAQALSTGFNNFSVVEFCEKLITRLGRDPNEDDDEELTARPRGGISRDGWVALGEASQTFFRRSPALHFLYKTFNEGPPVKSDKRRKIRKKDEDGNRKATEPTVKNPGDILGDAGSDEATTVEVEHIMKILKRLYRQNNSSPICYFEFVTNPHSFSQTIENVFYTAFLIRDGFARMFLDDDELPVIEPVIASEGVNADGEAGGDNHAMVMAWTMKDWRDVIEAFEIKTPVIPTRPSTRPSGTASQLLNGKKSQSKKSAGTSKDVESSDDD